ncbi:MAG: hypothetical protein AAFX79_09355 [Planctomycetota bacterium]
MCRHSATLSWHGSLIGWLVGIHMGRLAVDEMLDCMLLHGPFGDDIAPRIAVTTDALAHQIAPLSFGVACERAQSMDVVQRTHTDGGAGRGRFIPAEFERVFPIDGGTSVGPFGESVFSNVHWRLFWRRVDTEQWFEEYYGGIERASEIEGHAWSHEYDSLLAKMDEINPPGFLIGVLAASPRVVLFERAWRARVEGMRLVLAIESCRLGHDGAPPPSLADLGDTVAPEQLIDPISGGPWIYRPTPAELDEDGEPIAAGGIVWPYELRSAPLPGFEGRGGSGRWRDPRAGILITRPIPPPTFDDP